jgi:uncharacterized SAM-binding protein YcdF (DUF218 family)
VTRGRRAVGGILVLLLAAAAVFHAPILNALGSFLVSSDPPERADIVFVAAGDIYGNRILKGAELVREGYAPKALISGPEGMYGFYECDLAIPFAERAGYPASYFIRFPNHALSTRDEAAAGIGELRALGVRRVLLVTSSYHTRRAGKLFRAAAPDLRFIVVAAPDRYFMPSGWWHDRQARKIFVVEWAKTFGEWFNL